MKKRFSSTVPTKILKLKRFAMIPKTRIRVLDIPPISDSQSPNPFVRLLLTTYYSAILMYISINASEGILDIYLVF